MRHEKGFSLVELMLTVAIVGVITGMGILLMSGAFRRSAVMGAQREVAGQIRAARYTAVTSNKAMQVRFGCPAAGQFRVLEVTGNSTIDNDAARCSYPWPDPDASALPNLDGPTIVLPDGVSFGATQNLQINTNGQISPLSGSTPAVIQVTDGSTTAQVSASSAGRVLAP